MSPYFVHTLILQNNIIILFFLDLLITSLSDTLTEHPELMAAAKEGFSKYLDTYPNSGNHLLKSVTIVS